MAVSVASHAAAAMRPGARPRRPLSPAVQGPVADLGAVSGARLREQRAPRFRSRRRSRRGRPPPTVAAKTVVSTWPLPSTTGPAGVAGPHEPPQRRQQPRHRALAVGVLGDHALGAPDRAPPRRRTARSRDSRGSRRPCPTGRTSRARARAGRARARAGPRCRRRGRRAPVRPPARSRAPPTSTVVSLSPATTCALVTTRSGAATQPEPSIARPQAVPSTRTTLRRGARTPGRRSVAGRRRRHVRRGAGDRGQRVEPRERVEDRRRTAAAPR